MPKITPEIVVQAIYTLFAVCVAAFGVVAALRMFNFSREVKVVSEEDVDALAFLERQGFVPRPKRKRTSQCFDLRSSGAIRTVKGGYIRAFEIQLEPTMYAPEGKVEGMYDQAAMMLAAEKPVGTILQTRVANFTDFGRALSEHRAASGKRGEVYEPARLVHEGQLSFFEACAMMGAYKDFKASAWLYVPAKHKSDHTRNGSFVSMKAGLELIGRRKFREGLKKLLAGDDGIIRRLREEEELVEVEAEKLFRQLEENAPVPKMLRRLTREETWQALYYGHNESARSAPPTPAPGTDLRPYLCGDDITSRRDDWFVRHGRTPVAMVSLMLPPNNGAQTDIMRHIVLNARLSRRFTVITEYVYLNKEKEVSKLQTRRGILEKVNIGSKGRVTMDKKTRRAAAELDAVEDDMTNSNETLTGMDFRILVYGDPYFSKEGLKDSLKQLELDCENIMGVVRKNFSGCDARLEAPAALRSLYHRSVVGEMTKAKSYRMIRESTDTLAPFIALERNWKGIKNPTSVVNLASGQQIGINLHENDLTSSSVGIILAEPGGGKSVLGIRLAADLFGSKKGAQGAACDKGESFGPYAESIGGKRWRFNPDVPMPINVWSYPGIENRALPDEAQINFVVEDALTLANAPRGEGIESSLYKAVVRKCVEEVYKDEVPNNRPGWPRHEPQHKHLVRKLRQMPFEGDQHTIAQNLAAVLERFINHPWIDAPTDPAYREESIFDVFELDSLDKFDSDIRKTLAYRTAVLICNRIGKPDENGELTPTMLLFDEMQEWAEKYPEILRAVRLNAARQGRKKRTFTLILSQAWKDIAAVADITATAGVKIIGKQADADAVDAFIKAAKWPNRAKQAIHSVHNIKGIQSQFVISFGSGNDMQIEMINVELSPVELWTYTTAPVERNALKRVKRRMPDWSTAEAIIYLASKYPRGLIAAGREEPDLRDLPEQPAVSEELMFAPPQHHSLPPAARESEIARTVESYRLIGDGKTGGELPSELMQFAVRPSEEARGSDVGDSASPSIVAALDDATREPEVIEGLYAGEQEDERHDLLRGALELLTDFVDERTQRGRSRAEELGVDVPGAIVVERDEEPAHR
jgi:hypothetical protein